MDTGRDTHLAERVRNTCLRASDEEFMVLCFDVADYVQANGSDVAREAVYTIVNIINQYRGRTALRAIEFLDLLVKNCGYPVHLHVSRRGFLKLLAQRFPTRAPNDNETYTKVQWELLDLINKWYHTICRWGNYKEELVYIKDLYNMLVSRGYIFPKIPTNELQLLKPTTGLLQTFTEYNTEQETILSTKLNELIRRGKPNDLKMAENINKKLEYLTFHPNVLARKKFISDITILKQKMKSFQENIHNNDFQPDNVDPNISELYSEFKDALNKLVIVSNIDHGDLKDPDKFMNNLLVLHATLNDLISEYEEKIRNVNKTQHDQDNDDKGNSKIQTISLTSCHNISEKTDLVRVIDKLAISNDKISLDEEKMNKEEDKTQGPNEENGKVENGTADLTETLPEERRQGLEIANSIVVKGTEKKTSLSGMNGKQFGTKAIKTGIVLPHFKSAPPVTTLSISTAESSGQFNFTGKDEVDLTKKFEPFKD